MAKKSRTDTDLLRKGLSFLPELVVTKKDPVNREAVFGRPLAGGDTVRLDFGRHVTGRLSLELGSEGHHPDAPVLLQLRFAEVPWEFDEDPDAYHGWVCASWVQDEKIHIDTLPCSFRTERRYAFRYVEIRVLAISSRFRLVIRNASAYAESSAEDTLVKPFEFSGEPDSFGNGSLTSDKDSRMEELDRIACSTLHECMQHVFEDGPKRDRRLWMGDLRIQALVNYETYHMTDMLKGCLYLFGALTLPDGHVAASVFLNPEPCPDDMPMFDYSLLFTAALDDYYRETGDAEALKDLWPIARRQILLAKEDLDENSLVRDSDRPGWCFLDWSMELNRQAGAQGVLLYALLAGIRLARACGDSGSEISFRNLYESCRRAALKYLYDKDKGLFVSGKNRQISYASQVWMVLGRAVEGQDAVKALERVKHVPDAVHMTTPYMVHHYVQALLDTGNRTEALDVLDRYWGGMADHGADTFWELYDPDDPKASPYGGTIVNSYCHAWSCGPAYFLRKYFDGKLKDIRGVIFDLDGVLVSTDAYHYRAWKVIADELKIPFDKNVNNRLRGVSRMVSLEIILENYRGEPLTEEAKKALAERKNKIYRSFLAEMNPDAVHPSVRRMLSELKRRGYRLAVGSSSKNTMYILERTDLGKYFDAVADGNVITKSKPDPEVFLKAAEMINLQPDHCLVVEDAESGIEAACAGGMKAAGVQGAALYEKTDVRLRYPDELLGYLPE